MSQEEDQANEFEALAAIFDADFHITHDTMPRTCELVLVPNADGENNHVAARLFAELPPEYPAAGQAKIRVRSEKGLLERHIAEITALIAEKVAAAAESNEVAIYTVAEAVREYIAAPERNTPALSMYEQMAARQEKIISEEDEALAKRRALEERIEAKKKEPSPLGIEPGTLLTAETFARWRALFDAEQKAIRDAKEAARPKQERLTGKQLFMQNLAKELGEAEAEQLPQESAQEAAEAAKGSVFFFNEDLFLEDDDEDFEGDEAEGGDDDKHAISDDDEDSEDDDDDDKESMFDTTTNAEKQVRGASAAAAASAAASSAAAASAAAAAAAATKKPAAAAASAAPSRPAASYTPASAAPAAAAQSAAWEKDKEAKAAAKEAEGKKKKEKEVKVLSQSERDKAMQGKAAQAKKAAALAAKGGKKK